MKTLKFCRLDKKPTINPKNDDDKCFQYAVTVLLNYEKSKTTPKEYQRLFLSWISMNGKRYIFHQSQKTRRKNLKETVQKSLLMFCSL